MDLASEPSVDADTNQRLASDPEASAWVSANAGTGKTEVLVRRILRLLLAGSVPESILCLTYTKTAAAEMQNRLLKELASWATMPSDKLEAQIAKLTRTSPDETHLGRARRLFARTLEAKGGLKIHTIHGFCERLLQRFPLEAAISPRFTVLDDQKQAELKRAAFDTVVGRAAEDREAPLGRALGKIIAVTSEDYFRKVVDVALDKRAEIDRMVAHHDGEADWAAREEAALKCLLNVAEEREHLLIAAMADVLTDAAIDDALRAFAAHASEKAADQGAEAILREARSVAGERRMLALTPLFLTGSGAPRSKVTSVDFARTQPDAAKELDAAQSRFVSLDRKLAYLRLAEASGALLALTDAIKAEYQARKDAEAALDYNDLIDKAQRLLLRSGAAAWVLYKIDGGVDHILVDEAQDTNPAQWTIVEKLAEEFFAGLGGSGKLRTLFAVGDEKQSIYSFQGADPAKFGASGRAFRAKAIASGQTWRDIPLNVSFRSIKPILDAVDSVFAAPPASVGVVTEGTTLAHYAHRRGQPGLVELWEVEEDTPAEPANAFEPWSEERSGARSVDALCARIAGLIKHWIDSGEYLPSANRGIKAGDILILVRRREPFTAPMFRALKERGINVAGADRMKLMNQLAVEDLAALADVLLMRDDDLALAVVLKSPLFGLTDDELFELAHRRSGSLWDALMRAGENDFRFTEAATLLAEWLARADFQPPYEFFSQLLEKDGQKLRKRFLARLGPEASEALDEFLDRALAYDGEEAPSLQGFVNWLRATDIEIKRDMDQDRDEVRIMTVHGAKGLQAPIVFLPDTCMGPRLQHPRLFGLERPGLPPGTVEHYLWPPKGLSSLDVLEPAKTAAQQAEREEYHRLLYVAMTRARDRLYVCGWQGARNKEKNSWYELVESGIATLATRTAGHDGRAVRRIEIEPEETATAAAERRPEDAAEELPRWATTPAPPEEPRFILTPSRLWPAPASGTDATTAQQPPLGPQELAGNKRFSRGRLIHTLLQYLPDVAPEERERAARSFVALRGPDLPEEMLEEIVNESLAIVREPDFAPLFAPGSLGEVPVVARFGKGATAKDLSGQIDRLAVTDDDGLLILDYKTNRPPPAELKDVAEGYIAQLAAYRLALRRMFPGRNLRAAIVWTDGPRLMEIPSTLLDDAERRIRDAACMP